MTQQAFKHFLSAISLLVLIFLAPAHAEVPRGKVVSVTGEVTITGSDGKRHSVEEAKFLVREMDTISTAEDGSATVRFNDGVLSVLNEKSSLQVGKSNWLSQLGGKIYFTYRKVFGGTRQVKTRFATLGIRGTTFIVYDDDSDQGVALQEGLLDIESTGPAFEIHRQRELDEFDEFRQQVLQQQQEERQQFVEYRQQLQEEFIEYKQSFTLQANHVIRFDGARVDESPFDDNVRAEFEEFEEIAGKQLIEFREQARQHREMLESQQQLDEEKFE